MLLRKPTPTPASPVPSPSIPNTRAFSDLDASLTNLSSVPLPSMSPAPTSPQSKTHAFFSSPFSTRPPSPMLPPKKSGTAISEDRTGSTSNNGRPAPPRSLTADFFSMKSSPPLPLPPKPSSPLISIVPSSSPPKSSRRNFLNLELGKNDHLSTSLTLAETFTSTPTPTESKEEFYKELGQERRNEAETNGYEYATNNYDSSPMDAACEPTPRPPSRILNMYRLPQPKHEANASPAAPSTQPLPQNRPCSSPTSPSITDMGTEPDAEVLSTSPSSFSHLSVNMILSTAASGYPSRPTSALSYCSNASSQDAGAINIMQFVPSIGQQEFQCQTQLSNLYPTTDEVELAPGMIIRSFLPRSVTGAGAFSENEPLSPTFGLQSPQSISAASSNSSYYSNNSSQFQQSSQSSSNASSSSVTVTLKLTRPLGQGTFSSVWLAEDLSPEALLIRSKKSLRDLKRKSTRDLKKGGEREKEKQSSSIVSNGQGPDVEAVKSINDSKLKTSLSTTSSLMRRLRGGVSGTRPGGASASTMKKTEHENERALKEGEAMLEFGGFGMGRRGTIMPLPSVLPLPSPPSSQSSSLDLPPSLIPGHPSSSSSPKAPTEQTLGIGVPVTMGQAVSAQHRPKAQNERSQNQGPGLDIGLGLSLPPNSAFSQRNRVVSTSSGASVYLEFSEPGPSGEAGSLSVSAAPHLTKGPVLVETREHMDTTDDVQTRVQGQIQNQPQMLSPAPQAQDGNASVSRTSSISWKSCLSSPPDSSDEGHGSGNGDGAGVDRYGSVKSVRSVRSYLSFMSDAESAPASRRSSTRSSRGRDRPVRTSRLVAVKLTSRGVIEERERKKGGDGGPLSAREKEQERERARERDRTRVSFVREVEVMKHISHPNITTLLSHLTTRTHHVLVLPYLPRGDLLGLVNDDHAWNNLGESTLCRIFAELCKAVGWMHGVGLVHRDIKLENILLAVPLGSTEPQPKSGSSISSSGTILADGLTSPSPTSYTFPASATPLPASPHTSSTSPTATSFTTSPLPPPPQPLIKLTDFGLSRFIDPANPLLTTRCGSEAYAAPELVMGGGRAGVASSTKSPWFEDTEGGGYANEHGKHGEGAGGYDARETDAWAVGVVLYALVGRRLPFGEGPGSMVGGKIGGEGLNGGMGGFSATERRQWLMKIARGDWTWPEPFEKHADGSDSSALCGPTLAYSVGAKRAVERLLVRDPSRRARVKDLWEDEWLSTSGVRGGSSWANTSVSARDIYAHTGERNRASTVEGLPSGTDAYTSYVVNVDEDMGLASSSIPGLPSSDTPFDHSCSTSTFAFGSMNSGYGASSTDQGVQESEEEEFDNDRREREDGEAPGSRQDYENEDEDEDEEEDGEGWLVDKDGINHIARSEVPR